MSAPAIRLLIGNVLWSNDRLDALVETVVAVSGSVDVVALCELTVAQAARLHEVLGPALGSAVVEGRDDTEGVALWSRLALRGRPRWFGAHRGIDADIALGPASVRLLFVHPDPPLPGGIADWRRDLAMIAQEADEAVGPVVVCGDFNATVWHRALRPFWRNGFVDAHVALGDRWSRSWPAGRLVPRLARLDHALVRELVPRSVTPVPLPGSDHDGFVVELGLVRSAERVELAP